MLLHGIYCFDIMLGHVTEGSVFDDIQKNIFELRLRSYVEIMILVISSTMSSLELLQCYELSINHYLHV